MAEYRTTHPIWTGKDGQTKLPVGSLVEFDGEPTGAYRGRCVPAVEAPADEDDGGPKDAKKLKAAFAKLGAERDALKAQGAKDAETIAALEAKVAELGKANPPPPPTA